MNSQELRAALAIGLLYIIRMLGLFMLLPVLPLVGNELPFATPLLIGLALGVYGLTQALLQIPMGLMSDRWGRKPVILAGLLLFIAGSLVAASASTIYGVIFGRLLQGCGAIASSLLALVSDVTRIDQRSKAMAIIGISIATSFAVALVTGPLLLDYAGLSGLFMFSAVTGVLGIVVLFGLIPTPRVLVRNLDSSLTRDRVQEVIRNTDLQKMTLGVFMLHYLLMSGFLVFPVLLIATGEFDATDFSGVYLGLLVATFVLMGPCMWLADRSGFAKGMLLGMIGLFAVSMLLFATVSSTILVLASMMLFFMAFNLLEVIMPALLSRAAPAGARGTAMGVYSTAQFAGAFAGGAVGGLILSMGEITHLLYFNAMACVIWFATSWHLKKTGNLASKVFHLGQNQDLSANAVADALLSLDGVLDVVFVDDDNIAYLKIDKDRLDENALATLEHGKPADAKQGPNMSGST
mgnify:CR=1 FL=1